MDDMRNTIQMFQDNILALPVKDYQTGGKFDPSFFSVTTVMPHINVDTRRNSSLGLGGREMERNGQEFESRMSTGRLKNHSGGEAEFVYSQPMSLRPRDNIQMGGSMDLITEAQDRDMGGKGGYRPAAVKPR